MQIKKRGRSFAGCDRCKRRHQKCDEAKPSCSRCVEAEERCSYSNKLSWGGRRFDKSCFGVCLQGSNVSKFDIGKGNFIYATTDEEYGQRPDELSSIPGTLYLESLSKMPQTHRYLLHFFLNETSRIISCHEGVWKNFCQTVMPMAVEHTCLLSAVLALSGNYLVSSGIPSHISGNMIAQLKCSSIVELRSAFNGQTVSPEVLLSTTMLLCLCDIHSGVDATASWRIHFQGAQALAPLCGISYSINQLENQDTSKRLLAQMYTSIEMIVSLTTKGLSKGQCNQLVQSGNPYIDEYFGVSTDLLGIIYQVGAAAAERRRMDRGVDSGRMLLGYDDLLREADYLERTVCNMIFRDQKTPIPFHSRVENIFTPQAKREYILCNEAYQHTALINILRRVRKLPITSPQIQLSLQRILDIASQMNHTSGLSPWLLMSTPLFTAGSVSLPLDRQRARKLMVKLHENIRISNYRCSLELLDLYWKKSDEEGIEDVECVLEQYADDFISCDSKADVYADLVHAARTLQMYDINYQICNLITFQNQRREYLRAVNSKDILLRNHSYNNIEGNDTKPEETLTSIGEVCHFGFSG